MSENLKDDKDDEAHKRFPVTEARRKKKTGGREIGTPNKVSTTVKQAVLDTFTSLGGVAAMTAWAKRHPSEFYKIAARLIPQEVTGKGGGPIQGAITIRFV